jgi:hypothetical protein
VVGLKFCAEIFIQLEIVLGRELKKSQPVVERFRFTFLRTLARTFARFLGTFIAREVTASALQDCLGYTKA